MSNLFAEFEFLRPIWLVGIPIALLLLLLSARFQRSAGWFAVMDRDFIRHLGVHLENDSGTSRLWWLVPAILAFIALAGPSWQALPGTAASNRQALIIALDLSPSMLATDLRPSRLSIARLKLIDMLRQRTEGETALLVYAGSVHQVTPLTDDPLVITNLVETLNPAIMPVPGSRAEDAVSVARLLLDSAGLEQGDILLITDGIADAAIKTIEEQLPKNYRLSILAPGTVKGAPVPANEGTYIDNASGDVITAKLDAASMRSLVDQFNGRFTQATLDSADIEHLSSLPPLPFRAKVDDDIQHFDSRHDAGYWLCLALLPMIAWLFRRQLLFTLVQTLLVPGLLVSGLLVPLDSEASEWHDRWQNLWQTPAQRAAAALTNPDQEPIPHQFESPQWQAIARYRQGDFDGAVELLKTQTSAVAFYNLGNSLAMSGDYENALSAYEQALNTTPKPAGQALDDMVFNHLLVTALLNEQNEQETQINTEDERDDGNTQDDNQGGDDSDTTTEDEQSSATESASEGEQQQVGGNTGQGQSLAQGALQEQGPSSTANPDNPSDNADAQDATQVSSDKVDSSATDVDGNPADTTASEFEQNANTVLNPYSEQWLRSLPQDPGGYLRRKFQYEYQLRETTPGKGAGDQVRY